jgi:hypothetical protein
MKVVASRGRSIAAFFHQDNMRVIAWKHRADVLESSIRPKRFVAAPAAVPDFTLRSRLHLGRHERDARLAFHVDDP